MVTIEVLHVADCPNLEPLLANLAEATDLPVTIRQIDDGGDLAGSPTLLIDGADPFAVPGQESDGVRCRIYRDEHGTIVPAPTVEQIRAALATHLTPPAVLSEWRTRAVPLDPAQQAVHRAILRTWGSTGRPPAPDRYAADVLAALHDLDAIRLGTDGRIAVAYPFSARPTRHRVRIGAGPDVYAMCAVDAIGIAAMLDTETRIESTDPVNGRPVTVDMPPPVARGRWDPATAVVFVGAAAGGGPSADCCCDYLNFFADHATAQSWVDSNPHIPGQIVKQADVEDLGARLFGPLLR